VSRLLLEDSRAVPFDVLFSKDAEGMHMTSALIAACENGHTDVVKLLLDDVEVLSEDTEYSLGHAVKLAVAHGHAAVLDALLLNPKFDPSVSDNRAIKIAASQGRLAMVKQPAVRHESRSV